MESARGIVLISDRQTLEVSRLVHEKVAAVRLDFVLAPKTGDVEIFAHCNDCDSRFVRLADVERRPLVTIAHSVWFDCEPWRVADDVCHRLYMSCVRGCHRSD